MIEAVIFDLDGTLVDLPIDYEKLLEEFKRIMRTNDVRPLANTISRVDEKTRESVFKAWERAELAISNRIVAKETGLKIYGENAGKRKALVTLQGKNVVDTILRDFGLKFDAVVTREDALFRVDQLLKAIQRLEVDKQNVLFVGNTNGDAAAASKVGCHFLGVK